TLDALLGAPEVSRVIAVTRRPLGREHPRLANRIVQFERLESQLKGSVCDVALCCLGTTLRKAGSQQRFRAVDADAVLAVARAAKAANARRFVVMSSVGADPRGRNFYLRTTVDMDEELEGVAFESLDILQPSMLLAWRAEMRPLELVASALMPLIAPVLRGKSVPSRASGAGSVPAAMLGATRSGRRGVQRYTYEGIQALARLTTPRTRPLTPAKAPARARYPHGALMRAAPVLAAAVLATVIALAGCAGAPREPPRSPQGNAIAAVATSLIGTPYQFGGADGAGFDCSGLALYVHERVGLTIPPTAAEPQPAAQA